MVVCDGCGGLSTVVVAHYARAVLAVVVTAAVLWVGPVTAVLTHHARYEHNERTGEWWTRHYFGDPFRREA